MASGLYSADCIDDKKMLSDINEAGKKPNLHKLSFLTMKSYGLFTFFGYRLTSYSTETSVGYITGNLLYCNLYITYSSFLVYDMYRKV